MQEFKRRRVVAIVGFDARDQLIPGIGFDPQLQVRNIVGDGVGRNDFDGVTAGKQIQRQLSRAGVGARDDSCQYHKSRRLGRMVQAGIGLGRPLRDLVYPGSAFPALTCRAFLFCRFAATNLVALQNFSRRLAILL